jgi:hypothetical protein
MDGYLRMGLRSGVVLLLAAGLSGCGGGNRPVGPTDTATTTTSEGPFTTPTPEPTTTTTVPEPTDDNPIISLPSLPVGGGPVDDTNDGPTRQCVDISWISDAQPDIPQGYALEVTGAIFSANGYQVIGSGCGSNSPNCIGYIMRTGKDSCSLAVRTLPDARPNVGAGVALKGILYCPRSVGMKQCQKFADAVAKEHGTADLSEPTAGTDTETGTDTGTDTGTPTTSGD